MANSLSYGGTDLATYGLYVTRQPSNLIAPVEFSSAKAGFADRGFAGYSSFGPRELVCECLVVAATRAALATALDNIRLKLFSREDAALIFDGIWAGRYWMARLSSGVNASLEAGAKVAKFTLAFQASDPFAYSTSAGSDDETITSGVHSFSVVVAGTAPALPVFTVVPNATSAPVVISNETTGEKIAWENSLASTDEIRIDCATQYIDVADQATDTYAASMSNVDGQFPTLAAGVTNSLIISGVPGGSVNTAWRNRYM